MTVHRSQGMLSQASGSEYGPMPGVVDLNKGFTLQPGQAIPPNLDAGTTGVRSLLSGRPHPTVTFLILVTVLLALLLHHKVYARGAFAIGG